MKKQLLFITAGTMLAFASCKNETPATAEAGASQAQIDSMVNAKVDAIRADLMAQNDSMINAMAQWKADSMIAAMKGAKHVAPKPVAKAKPAPVHAEQAGASNKPPVEQGPATGKVTGDQGQATGKNTSDQGQATGKRR